MRVSNRRRRVSLAILLGWFVTLFTILTARPRARGEAGPPPEDQPEWEVDQGLRVKLHYPFKLEASKRQELFCVLETDTALWVGAENGLFRWLRGNPKHATILAPTNKDSPFEPPFTVTCL